MLTRQITECLRPPRKDQSRSGAGRGQLLQGIPRLAPCSRAFLLRMPLARTSHGLREIYLLKLHPDLPHHHLRLDLQQQAIGIVRQPAGSLLELLMRGEGEVLFDLLKLEVELHRGPFPPRGFDHLMPLYCDLGEVCLGRRIDNETQNISVFQRLTSDEKQRAVQIMDWRE